MMTTVDQPQSRYATILPFSGVPVRVPTRFRIFCMADRVYLCIGNERGEARVVTQMDGGRRGRWELKLRLLPGTYLYHYFANDGDVTTYVSPRDVDDMPTQMDGMSALLVVPEATDQAAEPPSARAWLTAFGFLPTAGVM
jgi:hypothetical protein